MHRKPPILTLSELPGGPAVGTLLVRLQDIAPHGGKSILFQDGENRLSIFVQKWGGHTYVYENSCPHAGTPLNLFGEKFLTIDGGRLICRTHGAQFSVDEGYCTLGPCKGQSLRPVAVEERDGALYSL